MKLYYDEVAKFQIRDAIEYGRQEFGPYTASRFRLRLKTLIQEIKINPTIGKIETELSVGDHIYRSVNIAPFKILYSVKEDCLRIHLLWNTRKNPSDFHL